MHGLLENASAACIEPLHRYAFANTIAGMDDTGDGRGIDGARVRDLRKARGWTQIDLAKASGVSQSALSRIERGVGTPRYDIRQPRLEEKRPAHIQTLILPFGRA